ncbi:MAG: hypothetical protein ACO2PK_13405 [Armatimonadota bacterium]
MRFTRRQKAWLQLVGCSFCMVLSGVTTLLSAAEVETVRCVKAMPREGEQRFYAANRPPLLPSPLVPCPALRSRENFSVGILEWRFGDGTRERRRDGWRSWRRWVEHP